MSAMFEILTYIDSYSTALVIGTNAFAGYLPETTGRAVAVFETGGLPPVHTYAGSLPIIERPRVQIIARSTRPTAGAPASATGVHAIIDTVWRLLDGIANRSLSGTTYLRVAAVQRPFLLEIDSRGRQIWSANFDCSRRKTTSNL